MCRLSDLISALQKTQDLKGNLPVVLYEKVSDKLFELSSVVVTKEDQLMLSLRQVDQDSTSDSVVQICI
jgi:hypothetical protein